MEDWKKKAENLKDKVVGEAKEAYGKLVDDKATEAEGTVQSTTADVKNRADELREDAEHTARELKHDGQDFSDELRQSISSDKPIGEKVGDVFEDVKEAGGELGENLKEKAEDIKDFAEDKFNDLKNRFKK